MRFYFLVGIIFRSFWMKGYENDKICHQGREHGSE